MTYQIVILDSYEVSSGKYLLEMDSCPILPLNVSLLFPISVRYKIGGATFDGQIVLAHYQFTEMIDGFWSYQRECILRAAPGLSFAGQMLSTIEIKD
ncbi:hypothetical protein K6V35_06110 [Streptococcus suis]|nr:hypothetical protein [Streptococcus suis]MBY5039253.1 hypothetical protein [Streptococcus suis]HEM6346559.1 hypothetical protein [Streptococcus suis]